MARRGWIMVLELVRDIVEAAVLLLAIYILFEFEGVNLIYLK